MGFAPARVQTVEFASKLKVTRICAEDIAAGDIVKSDSDTLVSLATNDSTLEDAQVFGMALQDKLTGEEIDILLEGVAEFPVFSVFSLNDILFLDVAGGITNDRPATGFLIDLGKHLGGNQVLFSPGKITDLV